MSPRTPIATHVLSPHPLVLAELSRWLSIKGIACDPVRLQYSLTPGLGPLAAAPGSVCVVDACFPPVASESLVSTLIDSRPGVLVLVLAEELGEALAFPLLRLGVKGLLSYATARKQLLPALSALATGGCWVPRNVLSRFLDTLLSRDAARNVPSPFGLSRREHEVLDSLLQNLSNKEIGSRLNISERTVKFHVSNLLGKFSVQRRADLILKSLQHAAGA